MEEPQTGSSSHQSGKEAPELKAVEVERDWLVAHLADEAEYWKGRAEAIGRVLDEVIAEIDADDRRARSPESWQFGSSAQLSEDMGFAWEPTTPSFRAALPILLVSLVLWAVLGLLAFAIYRYFAG
jgi:hypothetical protein